MWTPVSIPCRLHLCPVTDCFPCVVVNQSLFFQNPEDSNHKVRMAVGNGLRKDIWEKFENRFKVPHIYEFFGATEGSTAFMNIFDRPGACGRLSPLIVRFHQSTLHSSRYVGYLDTSR